MTTAVQLLDTQLFASFIDTNVHRPYRVSCGWAGGRGSAKAVGQCFNPKLSADKTTELFIMPTEQDELAVLDTLAHENVHRWVGTECGHKGAFKHLALQIGLTGKMTSTVAGDDLRAQLQGFITLLGKYPHASLKRSAGKKQTTRLVKMSCPACENIARQSRKAALEYGLICLACGLTMVMTEPK